MNLDENWLTFRLILFDYKYLSIRKMFFDWLFPPAFENSTQLIESFIKFYFQNTNRHELLREIKSWGGGNESHNLVKIIKLAIDKCGLDYNFEPHRNTLESFYKIYLYRYTDDKEKLNPIGLVKGSVKDVQSVDYTYSYFRKRLILPETTKKNLLISRLLDDKVINAPWGEDKYDLKYVLIRKNDYLQELKLE